MGKSPIMIRVALLGMVGVLIACATCYSEPLMVEKNLFAPDRKPAAPEAENPARRDSNIPPGAIQLDGVFGYGGGKTALLRLKNPMAPTKKGEPSSPYLKVREGEQVGEYRVLKIGSRKVTLEKDGEAIEVTLFQKDKVSSPVPVPPQAVPPSLPQPPQAAPAGPGSQPPQPPVRGARSPSIPAPIQPAPVIAPGAPQGGGAPIPVQMDQGAPPPEEPMVIDPGAEIPQSMPMPPQPQEMPVPIPPELQR